MSTYYYLVCDEHKQRCDAASDGFSGTGALGHSFMLGTFCVKHRNCNVRITNEHEEGAIHEYEQPYKDRPNPSDARREKAARLLERAQVAEAELAKWRLLYGNSDPK